MDCALAVHGIGLLCPKVWGPGRGLDTKKGWAFQRRTHPNTHGMGSEVWGKGQGGHPIAGGGGMGRGVSNYTNNYASKIIGVVP